MAEPQHASRTKLLDAALQVVRTKGYSATRIDDVCAAAGLTKGSFFHHFRSKEDLALAAVARWTEVTEAVFAEAPYRRLEDPLDRVLGYVDFRRALLQGRLPEFTCFAGTMLQEVFDSYPEMKAAVDDENLDVTADHVLVLRNAGPQGGPGMPEWGMLPIPKKLLKEGVRDMLRISDARMSGTSYGACILHVSPESHVGGPLALIKTGDIVKIDIPNRTIDMLIDDAELEARRKAWTPPAPKFERGYGWMFSKHIKQADEGCDFDYLETSFGGPTPEPDIF